MLAQRQGNVEEATEARRLRDSTGLNQSDWGRAIGYSGVQVGRFERGEQDIPPGVLVRMREVARNVLTEGEPEAVRMAQAVLESAGLAGLWIIVKRTELNEREALLMARFRSLTDAHQGAVLDVLAGMQTAARLTPGEVEDE